MFSEAFTAWLLQAETPSIRFLTMQKLNAVSEQELQQVRTELDECGPIPSILSRQVQAGSWSVDKSFYTPKYTSTHWSMLLLSELAVDSTNPHFRSGADYMLSAALEHPLRWFEAYQNDLACFWANLLRYALKAGIHDDLRLDAIVGLLVDNAMRSEWRCRYNYKLPCAWGAARALWSLAALPPYSRSPQVDAAIQSGLSFLLDEYSLVEANYPVHEGGKINELWSRLNFPLFYQADILLVLRALAELGELSQPGAAPALEWLLNRRNAAGRWRGSNPFRSRTWQLGGQEEIDRWVSLQAALIVEYT
ncbi:MAG: hypothetical protein A2Z16_15145 [Chloroflexi bacterium RBG_16_54_18]|nr:MAG: hypothetical protein A2Z16_15145 [Chloroflexi bacterium RBG_16_54_18]